MVRNSLRKLKLVKSEKPAPTPRYTQPMVDGDIEPENLHRVLMPTATLLRSFHSEKSMMSYRRMIYEINRQGEFRYRTVRAETEMWGLIIWRMV